MEKLTEEEFLQECYKLLDCFGIDYTKDKLPLSDGGCSCIMNPKSEFYKLFGGHSINEVVMYVAEKLNKKTVWED